MPGEHGGNQLKNHTALSTVSLFLSIFMYFVSKTVPNYPPTIPPCAGTAHGNTGRCHHVLFQRMAGGLGGWLINYLVAHLFSGTEQPPPPFFFFLQVIHGSPVGSSPPGGDFGRNSPRPHWPAQPGGRECTPVPGKTTGWLIALGRDPVADTSLS